MSPQNLPPEQVVAQVRERYGKIASGEISGCGCSCGANADLENDLEKEVAAGIGYGGAEIAAVPEEANLGLGCGAPIAALAPAPGETVVDLGSGGGIDVFLASPKVGPSGHVIGVDMTPEMLERARATAAKHGFTNVEFRSGRLEALPIADATVDAVTSNCVINLVPDKGQVFREVARVLKPGGRLVVSDIVLERPLPAEIANDLYAWVGCVAGAMLREEYFAALTAAGLGEIEVLRDVDYVGILAEKMPDELAALSERTGVPLESARGVVRTMTFRARKPA
jgi:SAM-dependent methyltransferase